MYWDGLLSTFGCPVFSTSSPSIYPLYTKLKCRPSRWSSRVSRDSRDSGMIYLRRFLFSHTLLECAAVVPACTVYLPPSLTPRTDSTPQPLSRTGYIRTNYSNTLRRLTPDPDNKWTGLNWTELSNVRGEYRNMQASTISPNPIKPNMQSRHPQSAVAASTPGARPVAGLLSSHRLFAIIAAYLSWAHKTRGTREQPEEPDLVGSKWNILLTIQDRLVGACEINACEEASPTTRGRYVDLPTTSTRSIGVSQPGKAAVLVICLFTLLLQMLCPKPQQQVWIWKLIHFN